MWEVRINRLGGDVLEIIKNKWCEVENLLSIYGKTRVRQIRFLHKSLWEKEEKRTKRREKPVESYDHQSKVRVGLIFSNLKYCNSETEFIM